MSQDDATVMKKRQKVSKVLNARIDHLKREIARLQSRQRLLPYSALVASVRAGEGEAGERLVPKSQKKSSATYVDGTPMTDNTKASYSDRIEDAREEIKEIEGYLTDMAEGGLDPVLDDLLRESGDARPPVIKFPFRRRAAKAFAKRNPN